MEKPDLVTYWRDFFADLFVGTFKKIFLFTLGGLILGSGTLALFESFVLGELEWKAWIETLVLLIGWLWFAGFGAMHGLAACAVHITTKKLREMVGGLHDLLDLLTREVIGKFSKFNKNIPREELARTFDNIGKDFREKLRLKKGLVGFVSSLLFGMILKALKFFFLDNVMEELSKNPSEQISRSDIEHAVRRVGVEMMLSPITDNLFLLHILNAVILILIFGLPFGIFLLF